MSRPPAERDNGRATVSNINVMDLIVEFATFGEFGVGAQFLSYTIADGTRTANVAVPDHEADYLEEGSVISYIRLQIHAHLLVPKDPSSPSGCNGDRSKWRWPVKCVARVFKLECGHKLQPLS